MKKIIPSDDFLKELEYQFFNDETIISFSEIKRRNNIGSKVIETIKKYFFDKFGRDKILSISRNRAAKREGIRRTGIKLRPKTDEEKQRISEINKEIWKSRPDLMEIAIKNGKNTLGKKQTTETIQKRLNSRKGYRHSPETIIKIAGDRKGKPLPEWRKEKLKVPKKIKRIHYGHSQETKDKLKITTTRLWKNGTFKKIYKSKIQITFGNTLTSMGYVVQDEYRIEGKPYDFYLPSINLIIEFNGTFWHRDPRFYTDCILKGKSIWEKDKYKMDVAKSNGYDTLVVWQYDWENATNKEEFIKNIIHGQLNTTK